MSFDVVIKCDVPGCDRKTEPIPITQNALPPAPEGWYSYVGLGALLFTIKLEHPGEVNHACPEHAKFMGKRYAKTSS